MIDGCVKKSGGNMAVCVWLLSIFFQWLITMLCKFCILSKLVPTCFLSPPKCLAFSKNFFKTYHLEMDAVFYHCL